MAKIPGTQMLHLISANAQKAIIEHDADKTLSILIVDRSGSMSRFGQTPLDCLNAHLQSLQNPPDKREQYCTIIYFADEAIVELPLTKVESNLQIERYEADGNTLLWETVYQTMKLFRQLHQNMPGGDLLQVVVGVFSDGDDTRSDRQRQPQKLKRMAKKVTDFGWHLFSYGIGIDGQKLAEEMGFPSDADHAKTVEASLAGIEEVTRHFSLSTTTIGVPADFFKAPPPGTTTPKKP